MPVIKFTTEQRDRTKLKFAQHDQAIAELFGRLPSGGAGGSIIVPYTAIGDEAPEGFTVQIGATMPDDTYHVGFFAYATEGMVVPRSWVFLDADRTTETFIARFTVDDGTLTAGGVYKFIIVEAS